MNPDKTVPLLSDDNLKDAVEVHEYRSVPEDKLFRFRDLYEQERQKLIAEKDELVKALEDCIQDADNDEVADFISITDLGESLNVARAIITRYKPS